MTDSPIRLIDNSFVYKYINYLMKPINNRMQDFVI